MDYYAIMGLERSASADDIKRAYRRLARKYHPDVSKESDAEARFKEVGEAYNVLRDPESRKLYDQYGADWKRVAEGGAPGGGAEDPNRWHRNTGEGFRGFENESAYRSAFEDLFGGGGDWQFASRGQDYEVALPIFLETAYSGGRDTVTLTVPEVTSDGRIERRTRKLSVRIPKGVVAGQRLRLSGQGGAGIGRGEAGDIYAVVEFAPHPFFRVDGADILLDLPISVAEAALGATVTVPTLGGPVDLRIPQARVPTRN